MKKLLLKGGTVVSPRGTKRADVLISGEKIVAVGRHLAADAQVLNVSGKLIFPGFIDAHTEFEAQVGETVSCDDFDLGTKCALAGGVTTVLNCAVGHKGESLTDALNNWHVKAFANASCDYAFHMLLTDWNPEIREELPAMFEQGVSSFKAVMSGEGALDDTALLELMTTLKPGGGLLSCRCENAAIVERLRADMLNNGKLTPADLVHIHPDYAEAEAVHRFLTLARAANVPCAVTLSSLAGYAEVRRAREYGVKVYADTCPRYLMLDDGVYASEEKGAGCLCIPPLRKPEDGRLLWEALRNDRLQNVVSGHRAFLQGKKRMGESIADGLPEVQTLAPLLYTYGVKKHRLSLQQMCAYLSENPARLYGMYPKKGAIKAGADADLVVFDPKGDGVISASRSLSRAGYSPYEGMRTTGKIEQVFLRGRLVCRGGEVVLEHSGRYIPRGKGSL